MRKVLVITYYWPPSGGSGVQRTVKFCKYLSLYGWQPHVITVKDGAFTVLDNSFLEDVKNIDVSYAKTADWGIVRKTKKAFLIIQNPSCEVSRKKKFLLSKAKTFIVNNTFIPDNKIFWYKNAFNKAEELIRNENIDLVFTTSPPHSVHLIGLKIKKKYRLPWVADFRDPWLEAYWNNSTYRTSLAKHINRKLEKKVLDSADVLVTVGGRLKQMIHKKTKTDIEVISNGYDADNFKYEPMPSKKFILGYYGSLNSMQAVSGLAEVINGLKYSNKSIYDALLLRMVGVKESESYQLISDRIETGKIELLNYIEHSKLIEMLMQEQVLIQFIQNCKNNEVIIGAKLYEYIHTGNPVLCIGNKNGDASALVRQTKAGQVCGYDEKDKIREFIISCHTKWKNGELNSGKREIRQYERKRLAQILAGVFDKTFSCTQHLYRKEKAWSYG